MDALIADVGKRQTLRANDLWFYERDGKLWLAGADASPWAVLRRLGRGLLGCGAERRLLDWKELEFLRGDPSAGRQGTDCHHQITRLQAAEIARLLDALPYLHAAELLTLIPDPIAADALEAMTMERQLQVIQVVDPEQAVRLLAQSGQRQWRVRAARDDDVHVGRETIYQKTHCFVDLAILDNVEVVEH
jgi:hypothetical protein